MRGKFIIGIFRHKLFGGSRSGCEPRYLVDGSCDSTVVISLLEMWSDDVADDAACEDVGHNALHAIAGAYCHAAVVNRHEKQQPVVLIAFPYAPFCKQISGK